MFVRVSVTPSCVTCLRQASNTFFACMHTLSFEFAQFSILLENDIIHLQKYTLICMTVLVNLCIKIKKGLSKALLNYSSVCSSSSSNTGGYKICSNFAKISSLPFFSCDDTGKILSIPTLRIADK